MNIETIADLRLQGTTAGQAMPIAPLPAPTAESADNELQNVLLNRARAGIDQLAPEGYMLPGRNGAYGDIDTPVRNTSHWLVSFSYAYALTGDDAFKAAAQKALGYLLRCCDHFPGMPIYRHAPGKDNVNGVMGPAHVIEALFYASRALDSREAEGAAKTLISRLTFNPDQHCWNCADSVGKPMYPDQTFNHQLYYAAVIALFAARDPEIKQALEPFLKGLPHTFRIRADGRVIHSLPSTSIRNRIREAFQPRKEAERVKRRERDYHLYNMYAFALLKSTGAAFEGSLGFNWLKAVAYAEGAEVSALVSKASWPHSLTSGTETRACDFAYFKKMFERSLTPTDIYRAIDHLQYIDGPDGKCHLVSPDPVTQRARHYRYWRLLDRDPFQA